MMAFRRRLLPALIPLMLTACVTTPHVPVTPVASAPIAPVPIVNAAPRIAAPVAVPDFWSDMRDSFGMAGCDADPQVTAWARSYTKMPNRFEQQINEVLPLIVYAHKSAVKHGVAGEFALLPWVESQYRHVPGQKNRPAGMWQIMPQTAHTLGLRVEKNYDERLDITKSTESVMSMMRRYYDDLGDWRLVDVAYNTGEFGLKKTIDKHGGPEADEGMPDVPMKANTREHLAKLMAIACIVRNPSRFNVTLPKQDGDDALQVVSVSNPQSLAQAAKQSGLSMNDLRDFNPAYRTTKGAVGSSILLPKTAADQYKLGPIPGVTDAPDAVATATDVDNDDDTSRPASGRSTASVKGARAKTSAKPSKSVAATSLHKVDNGESLWSIARRNQVSVDQLVKWNGLQSKAVKPGQVLRLTAVN